MIYYKQNKGFTLIELLVVIAIIGVLAGAVIVIINPTAQLQRARDAQRRSDIKVIQKALEEHLIVRGSYPATSGWVCSNTGGYWIPGLDATYLKRMPTDPVNSATCAGTPRDDVSCYRYCYYSASWCSLSGRDYIMQTRLENYSNSDLSQKPFYHASGSFCSNWSESANNGLYVVSSRDL